MEEVQTEFRAWSLGCFVIYLIVNVAQFILATTYVSSTKQQIYGPQGALFLIGLGLLMYILGVAFLVWSVIKKEKKNAAFYAAAFLAILMTALIAINILSSSY